MLAYIPYMDPIGIDFFDELNGVLFEMSKS